jgi:guanylate kinase
MFISSVSEADGKSIQHSEKSINDRLRELGEPLLDFDLIRKTIEQWSRPLPASYLLTPLVLVGPSGVGKGRLVKALLKDYNRFFVKIVTHTTRSPRPDEIEGKSYHYVKNETFHEMVRNGEFLEWAKVHDNFYGTSIQAWKAGQLNGKISIMEIDVQGAQTVRRIASSYEMTPKYIFIAPPEIEKLKARLAQRY